MSRVSVTSLRCELGWTGWRERVLVVVGVFLIVGGGQEGIAQAGRGQASAGAQDAPFCEAPPARPTFDQRGLAGVYCTTEPLLTVPLELAHVSARPVFFGAVPSAWIGAAVTQDRTVGAQAYRLTLLQGVTYGLVLGLKHAVDRPRPYVDLPVSSRVKRYGDPSQRDAFLSLPSGHASLAAAIATSWSLSYPHWYVIGPGAVWATSVALSRLHLGLHYPSDVLTGALLGTSISLLVHTLRTVLTPKRLRPESTTETRPAVPVSIRVSF